VFTQVPEISVGQLPDPLPDDLVVLDVREDDEWAAGHLDPSVHIPLMQIPQRLDEIPRDQPLLVVCKVGARSAQATAYLQAQGVDASNLSGGLVAWQRAGRRLVAGPGQAAHTD
jgi:rhodanese-related sulfurtransferase